MSDTLSSPFLSIPKDRLACSIRSIVSMVKDTRNYRRTVLWSIVGSAFSHGSGVSREICIYAGLDPDQTIRRDGRLLELS